jgi:autotransporter strand-loop-strand O-heptosyltransferase
MKNRGIKVYTEVIRQKKSRVPDQTGFVFTFDYGPKVVMSGNNPELKRTVKFWDKKNSKYEYIGEIQPGLFTTLFRKWYTSWVAEIFDGEEKIWSYDFEESLKGQKILVSIDSASLGDTLAWMPVIAKFGQKHEAELLVSTFWNPLLSNFFENIQFVNPGYRHPSVHSIFGIGWYEEDDRYKHPRDPRTISLQQVASDLLGIEETSELLMPNISAQLGSQPRPIEEKYVCIATESTANAKHWHYPGGWQEVVNYLRELGYKVVVIHEQANILENVEDRTGSIDLWERMVMLHHAEFFIGIGSGISWLSWAVNVPVVMISGFSLPFCEFSTRNYRVINNHVCHGCFNDPRFKFDKGDWNWCPKLKNTERIFECTRQITPGLVKEVIHNLIQDISQG